MKKIYLIIVCSIICLAGCKNKDGVPSGILEREKMQAVLWDIMRADIFANQSIKKDSSKNVAVENAKLQLLIFDTHHVTKEEFYNSYIYYKAHTDLMQAMLDSLISQQEKERRAQFITPKPRSILNKFHSVPK